MYQIKEMTAVLDPALYIGRCPEQVERFLSMVCPVIGDTARENPEINL